MGDLVEIFFIFFIFLAGQKAGVVVNADCHFPGGG
jgi:hypothetical protein